MGIVILMILAYLGWLGYWQNELRHARRAHRWNRYQYCRDARNRILLWSGGIAAVAAAFYFS